MSAAQLVHIYVGSALLALVAAGLVVRGRVSQCWLFLLQVVATLACNLSIAQWPERLFVFTFYSMKETLLWVLTILVALEIWLRSFAVFRRARRRVGLALVLVLLATLAAIHQIPAGLLPYDALLGILCARQQAGALALFAVVVSAGSWYRVPLHPLHRAILFGFATYLVAFTLALSLIGWRQESWVYRWTAPIPPLAYTITELWWLWVVWTPTRAPNPTISRLQPWATSW